MRLSPVLSVLILLGVVAPTGAAQERPKNVIFMIADGFGPASVTMGRAARGAALAFDSVLVGTSETSATNSRVTDSAAGATALSCGIKTYNGAIAVDADATPCRTVLEAAETRGMATGVVATSRVTHATPASYASHVPQRSQEPEIAAQMAVAGMEVILGGGLQFFNGRDDDRDLVAEMRSGGANVALDRAAFDRLSATPAVALLANSHLDYEVDRDAAEQPSLAEMSMKALTLLTANPDAIENGFFLMIEGSRIDHAAHGNDPGGHLGDILAYDDAVKVALAFASQNGNTLVVSTADHETGGMTLGRDGVYEWDPVPLLAATMSAEHLAGLLRDGGDPETLIPAAVGGEPLSEDEAAAVFGAEDLDQRMDTFLDIVNKRARIGWTTSGHTAVDVNLYAFGPGSDLFYGAMANDAVGRAVFAALGL